MPSADGFVTPVPAGAGAALGPGKIGLGRGAAGLGRLFFALGLVGFGLESVLFGHYVVARATPWPPDPTYQLLFACVTGALLIAGGLAILTGRWTRELGLEAGFLILACSLALHWPKTIAGDPFSGNWTNALKAVVLATGGLLAALQAPEPVNRFLSTLRTLAPHACAPFFLLAGIQHILFAGFVDTLVPPFVPFPRFWTYFAAGALFASGFGLLTPPVRRLAATLTGWMVFSWVWLVHVPLIFKLGAQEWMGVFEALAISGVCLMLAASEDP
jgi:uncharacterized membrane protein